jgi:hypothetical protein
VQATHSQWFFPTFIVLWLAICGTLSFLGGWHELAERFKSSEAIEGEHFRFRSCAMGGPYFPMSYGSCLFATLGSAALRLSIFLPFRFLHSPLVIPWTEIERCEPSRRWLVSSVAIHIKGVRCNLKIHGNLGQKILDTWIRRRKP